MNEYLKDFIRRYGLTRMYTCVTTYEHAVISFNMLEKMISVVREGRLVERSKITAQILRLEFTSTIPLF